MNKTLRNILIVLVIIILLIITGMGVSSWKDNNLQKETTLRVESEMRFKQKEIEAKQLIIQLDSTKSVIDKKQTLIDYLENNPQVIIQNNDKTHLDINKLDALNSIVLFTNNVSKYDNFKNGRYNLHRFNKHN